jgi:hypothetical protein
MDASLSGAVTGLPDSQRTCCATHALARGDRAGTEKNHPGACPRHQGKHRDRISHRFRSHGRAWSFHCGRGQITAGYSAEGKYSHFFVTQAALKIGDMVLEPGQYVLGYQRADNETIGVSFYRAASGELLGEVNARANRKSSLVRSLLIAPPTSGRATIQIGRFLFDYRIA